MTEKHAITITLAAWTGGYASAVCTCGACEIGDYHEVLFWTNEHSYLQEETK